jgi:hypothetical protein
VAERPSAGKGRSDEHAGAVDEAGELMNRAGALHAGVQAALLDTACGYAGRDGGGQCRHAAALVSSS